MRTRILLALATLAVAAFLVTEVLSDSLSSRLSDLCLNLATELLGIFVTILVIDWLLDRRSLGESARSVALAALHELDHHVWVWQGGARNFDMAELHQLLDSVGERDPLPPFTQNLFLTLGSRAADTLRIRRGEVAVNRHLKGGLELLSKLTAMRDGADHLPPKQVADILLQATQLLGMAAEVSVDSSAVWIPEQYRGASVEQQEWRHYGTHRE
jgi:hypothetical protein